MFVLFCVCVFVFVCVCVCLFELITAEVEGAERWSVETRSRVALFFCVCLCLFVGWFVGLFV